MHKKLNPWYLISPVLLGCKENWSSFHRFTFVFLNIQWLVLLILNRDVWVVWGRYCHQLSSTLRGHTSSLGLLSERSCFLQPLYQDSFWFNAHFVCHKGNMHFFLFVPVCLVHVDAFLLFHLFLCTDHSFVKETITLEGCLHCCVSEHFTVHITVQLLFYFCWFFNLFSAWTAWRLTSSLFLPNHHSIAISSISNQ